MSQYRVAVLFGGVSSEHEISLLSAHSVLQHLNPEVYTIYPVGIKKDGSWHWYRGSSDAIPTGEWENGDTVPAAFCPGSGMHGLVLFEQPLRTLEVDVVFPVLHGKNGEDGTIQGLLEAVGIPYVGCGVLGSAVCMDKIIANLVMDAAGIDRCEWDWMERCDLPRFDVIEQRVAEKLHYPIFVKPANAGSSVGISKAHDKDELRRAVSLALEHDDRIVFERFVQGQEIECAVRGNEGVHSTLPGEILACAGFYTYDDKYVSGTSRTAIPASAPKEVLERTARIAERAYKTLCCRGLSRVDFFLEKDTGRILLNEINTLPGFTSISMYPKLMMNEGETYGQLLDSLIALAMKKEKTT